MFRLTEGGNDPSKDIIRLPLNFKLKQPLSFGVLMIRRKYTRKGVTVGARGGSRRDASVTAGRTLVWYLSKYLPLVILVKFREYW